MNPAYGIFLILLTVVGAVIIIGGMIRRESRRMQRAAEDQCQICGYDLRASRGRCPECGAPIDRLSIQFENELDTHRLAGSFPDARIKPVAPEIGEATSVIFQTTINLHAELVIEQLLARGIWAQGHAHGRTEIRNFTGVNYFVHVVAVRQADVDAAKLILNQFRKRPVVEPTVE